MKSPLSSLRRRLGRALSAWVEGRIRPEWILGNRYVAAKRLMPLEDSRGYFVVPVKPSQEGTTAVDSLPVPPKSMWEGYGHTPEEYLAFGREHMASMLKVLEAAGTSPAAFERVLDFGCAAGRMLRFFPRTSEAQERWGLDLKASTISWCQQNLSPPLLFSTNTTSPHLPFEDNAFDLVYAGSVFTHISDLPDAWFLELRRIVRKGGHLYLTIQDKHGLQVLFSQYERHKDPSLRRYVEAMRRMDADTHVLSQDYGCFSVDGGHWGGFPVPQVVYDREWLVRKWSRFARFVSATPEAYGFQTALLFQK